MRTRICGWFFSALAISIAQCTGSSGLRKKTSASRYGKISRLMKPIRWSAHARKKAAKREISETEVEQTIMQPDSTMRSQPPRQILMRRYLNEVLETEMLLRVIVEETDAEMVVVTLYKTSKFRKYEPGT